MQFFDHPPGELRHDQWGVGMCLAVLSSASGAIGDIIVRRSLLQFEQLRRLAVVPRWSRRVWRCVWVFGFVISHVVDEVLNFLALFFAPAALVAPVAGFHVALAVLLSAQCLGEPLTDKSLVCVVICVLGVTLCSVSAPRESSEHLRVIEVLEELVHGRKLAFLLATAAAVLALNLLSLQPLPPGPLRLLKQGAPSVIAGAVGGLVQLASRLMVLIFIHVREEGLYTVSKDPASVAIVAIHLLLTGLSIFWFNRSLKRLPAAIVVPISNCVYLYTAGVGSVLLFSETPMRPWLYFSSLGVVIVSTGMLFIIESLPDEPIANVLIIEKSPTRSPTRSEEVVSSRESLAFPGPKALEHCSVLPARHYQLRALTASLDEATTDRSFASALAATSDASFTSAIDDRLAV